MEFFLPWVMPIQSGHVARFSFANVWLFFFYIGECKGSKDLGFLPLTMQVKGPMQNCPHISLEGNKDKPMCLLLLGIPNVSQEFKMQNGFPFKFSKKKNRSLGVYSPHRSAFLVGIGKVSASATRATKAQKHLGGSVSAPQTFAWNKPCKQPFFLFGDTCHSNMIPFFM